jgi:3-phosphoshikimate 1-carboxyvinyltransferase
VPVSSAQVKSALLLAGLYAGGRTRVRELTPSRDHTERMLQGLGWSLERTDNQLSVQAGGQLQAVRIDVPGDMSLAAFFIVGAAIAPDSDLLLEHIGINPTRSGLIEILRLMGADIRFENAAQVSGEPVADIRVRYRPLQGIEVPAPLLARAIDELPLLMIAAACAQGLTRIRGTDALRHRADQLVSAVAAGLNTLGIRVELDGGAACIAGGSVTGGTLDAGGDYRVGMAFVAVALCAKADIEVQNSACVEAAFPEFVALARRAGFRICKEEG